MSSVEVPERVFIDPRVAKTMPEEPHTEGMVAYYVEPYVKKLVAQARGGDETVVQIQSIMEQVSEVRAEYLVALTSHGRIFERKGPDWVPVDLPEFET